ncbi:DUF3857 domain-containing protein [Pseudoxanthomonas koreensis]|uniref:DUF3857 domain-containing protein n=1 Tax=Pseudoxanthomonas koreensis TaxID=266061 RepID=UPI0013916853|nr:DUF3857 domain-containing protein [Pseudoxanthomonas koreensis]KAF1697748.1 transglutaminase [Pseudoxanthomonas koreensis]
MRNGNWLRRLAQATGGLLAAVGMHAVAADYRVEVDARPPALETLLEGSTPQDASDGLRYLLVLDQVDLAAARPAWSRRVAYDVAHERGLASAGQFQVDYQPAYQQLVLHAVELRRGDARIDRLGDSRIELLRRESGLEAGLMDGSRTLAVTIPDIRVGDRVEYRYTIHGYNPVFGRGYHDYWTPRYGVPVALREIRVRHPGAMPLRLRAPEPGFEQDEGVEGGLRWLRIHGRDVAASADEASVPDGHALLSRVEVTTAAGWEDVAAWASPLFPGRFSDRALAAELAAQLDLAVGDPVGSLERAVAFVQGEVRYTGLDMGLNSHAPNPPELVAKRRFGDCKDKSQLLVALLREAGIRAEPVLVNTALRARTAERLPSPLAFDHVVVRAHLPQGEAWIDATRDRESGPLDARAPLGFGVGLPVIAGTDALATIPYPFPGLPQVEVEQQLDFADEPPYSEAGFQVDTRYRPSYAEGIRDRFRDQGAAKVGEGYLAYMRGYYDDLQGDGDPVLREEGEEAVVGERYRLRWNSKDEGKVFGIVPFQLLDWTPRLAEAQRQLPLALGGPRFGRHTVRSRHPQGWTIADEHERVENPWFRFDRHVSVDAEGRLVIVAEWRRMADQVPAADYARVREDLLKVRELLYYDVDLEARWQIFGTRPVDWAWPAAALGLALASLALLWWRRKHWLVAGMLYRPRATAALRLATSGMAAGLATGACAVLAEVLLERGHLLFSGPLALALGMMALGLIGLGLRWLFLSWLLQATLAWLGHHAAPQDMRRAYGLALVPMTLFCVLAMVALGFRLDWLEADDFTPSQLPAVLVSVLLLLVGMAWWLVSLAGGAAAMAGTRMRRGVLAVSISVLPLVALATLAMVALSLR